MDGYFFPNLGPSTLTNRTNPHPDLFGHDEPDRFYTPRDGHTISLVYDGNAYPNTYLVYDGNVYLGCGTWYADGGALYFDTWEPAGRSAIPNA